MKSKFNFVLNWSDVVYPERNNIVFENRNKSYGAFAIRMLYERNLIFALLFSVFIFGGLLGLQALLKHPIETFTNHPPTIVPPIDIITAPVIQPEIRHQDPPAGPPSNPNNNNFIVTTNSTTPDTNTYLPPDNPNKGKGPDTSGSGPAFPEGGKGLVTPPLPEPPKIWKVVQKMPSFPGGDSEMMKYLGNQLIYPKIPLNDGIQGTVFVTFVVNQDGSLSDIKLMYGVDKLLNQEAVRVVKKMPKWNPGMQNGNPVRVQLTLPVKFKINEYR